MPLTDVLVVNRAEQTQIEAIGPETGQCDTVVTLGGRGAQIDDVSGPLLSRRSSGSQPEPEMPSAAHSGSP